MRIRNWGILGACVIVGTAVLPVLADAEEATVIQEIVVTAQKRAESAQDIGIEHLAPVRGIAVDGRDQGGTMVDAVATTHGLEHRAPIAQIALDPLHIEPGQGTVVAPGAHQNPDLLAVGEQTPEQVGPEMAGRPRQQYLAVAHRYLTQSRISRQWYHVEICATADNATKHGFP